MSQYTIVVIQHDPQRPPPPPPPPNNWPTFYPIIYHNLEDFPEREKTLLKRSYILSKLYVITLLVNSCVDVVTAIMTNNGLSVVSQLIASIIYLILLPFGDFFGRHLSLYLAFKLNDESSFRYFFFGETIVILFGVIISIGFIHGGSSGTLGAILYFRNKLYVLGVLISIFLFLVLVLTIFHIILTVQVYRLFKSRNFTICPRLNHTGATVAPDVRRAARLT